MEKIGPNATGQKCHQKETGEVGKGPPRVDSFVRRSHRVRFPVTLPVLFPVTFPDEFVDALPELLPCGKYRSKK